MQVLNTEQEIMSTHAKKKKYKNRLPLYERLVLQKRIDIKYCCSTDQLEDMFIKPLPRPVFVSAWSKLMVFCVPLI